MYSNDLIKTRYTLRFSNKSIVLYILFLLSCINQAALITCVVIITLYLLARYKIEGAIDCLIFVQLRSVFSSAIAPGFIGTASYIKWAVIFTASLYLWTYYKTIENKELRQSVHLILIFSVFAIFGAWITSSYPLTASFKVISYAIPFTAILIGVSQTPEIDWIKRITVPLGVICLGSAVLLFSPAGYIISGNLFQGALNHPNLYGVALALFAAGILHGKKKVSPRLVLVLLLAVYLLYRSGGRTGMLSAVVVILIWTLSLSKSLSGKITIIILILLAVATLIVFDSPIISASRGFIFKWGGNSVADILISREGILLQGIDRFLSSPIFGTGFNVPYRYGLRSYELSFDLIVENGSIITAVLGDVGAVGLLLFFIAYFKIFRVGRGIQKMLFFAPFLVSMGEMTFFSTNNIAIIMYLYFGVYARDGWLSRQPLPELAESEGPIR